MRGFLNFIKELVELIKLLALRPRSNVGERILRGIHTKLFTYDKGNAFSLHLFFISGRLDRHYLFIGIVQQTVRRFVNNGFQHLLSTHTRFYDNGIGTRRIIPFCSARNVAVLRDYPRSLFDSLENDIKLFLIYLPR